ncbi:unnamed protein product [Camellia sinensis]
MDLGMVGFDGLVGSDSCFGSSLSSDPDSTKQKWYGSGRFLGQERSAPASEDEWRTLKVAKTDDFSASKAMLSQQRGSLLRANSSSLLSDGQHMLSFSSPNSQSVTLPHYHQSSSSNSRNTGYGSGGGGCLNLASMHGVLMGVRGPFTPSQWMELEHQALIYKYITANMPIPHNLLIPIRKALDSAGFSSFTRPSTLGWGAFHLGFSNNTDPEPGRCRRTDGKKWRCSRDAVADQKYCERHMNRGRHRSRKPVEGQSGHSVSGPTTTTTVKLASSTSAALVVPGDGTTNSLGLSHHPQLKNLQPGAPNSCASTPHINSRFFLNNENVGETIQGATDLSMLSPAISLTPNQFSVPKQQNPYEQSSRSEFGSVCSDSLLNPLHKSSTLNNCRNYSSPRNLNDGESESQHSVHQFMDDWHKTQLSISIPVDASDFMSSTSSPANEKLALSPLRLSRELDSTQMGLGLGNVTNEPNQRQANWIPISWETSMGGPLGEVLHSTSGSIGDCNRSSALNLMTKGWDKSPRLASSPTGVLQKMTFGSLSNSSAGSSPRAENLGGLVHI